MRRKTLRFSALQTDNISIIIGKWGEKNRVRPIGRTASEQQIMMGANEPHETRDRSNEGRD